MSDIPYAGKFGGAGNMEMTLEEYIDEVRERSVCVERGISVQLRVTISNEVKSFH